jgi:hypothetical protein
VTIKKCYFCRKQFPAVSTEAACPPCAEINVRISEIHEDDDRPKMLEHDKVSRTGPVQVLDSPRPITFDELWEINGVRIRCPLEQP